MTTHSVRNGVIAVGSKINCKHLDSLCTEFIKMAATYYSFIYIYKKIKLYILLFLDLVCIIQNNFTQGRGSKG